MFRREALRSCNFRSRTVLLYSASRYEWLADHADEEIGLLDVELRDSDTPTVH
jgi:hypothetical protein